MAKKPLVGKRKRGHVVRREKAKQPVPVEKSKRVLLVRGTKAGTFGLDVLKDLKKVKDSEDVVLFSRKNDDIRPFEDETKMEFFCNKNDCGLFVFATHSKKRPNNLVVGRIYDQQTLDIVEFHLESYQSIQEMIKKTSACKAVGSQTAMLFQGEDFDKSAEMETVRSMLLDLFRARQTDQVDLTSIDHLVVCTATAGKIFVRNYVVGFKAKPGARQAPDGSIVSKAETVDVEGMKIPNLTLVETGPSMNLSVRRSKLPSPELMRIALKKAKNVDGPKKVKNVAHDALQGKMGRIHMKKQDFAKLVTRSRFKRALKRGDGAQ